MQVTILTIGSRGDVQPYVALGKGLRSAGHAVKLSTHAEFGPFARLHGLDFARLHGNPQELLAGDLGQEFLGTGQNPVRFLRAFARIASEMMRDILRDSLAACQGADLILFSVNGWFGAQPIMEKLRIPGMAAYLQPVSPTRAFPSISFPVGLHLGGLFNRLTYPVSQELGWQLLRDPLNAARKEVLGLPPVPFWSPFERMHRERFPILYGYSPRVLPKPKDWGDWLTPTGYWFLDQEEGWRPPASLVSFLEAGPPPVYLGFGSMRDRNPEQTTRLALEALELAGQRGLLLAGWGSLGEADLPESVYRLESAPHEWVFPRVAAAVHHGGAGTTAASLRSGTPTVTAPYFADQPFWGQRVFELGAGPRPIPRKRLTAQNLAAAIQVAVQDREMRRTAAELGAALRLEDGVGRAVEIIERLFDGHL
ncbi:MAG TPA: glycosyltransferase [Anaerolineales bacterium]